MKTAPAFEAALYAGVRLGTFFQQRAGDCVPGQKFGDAVPDSLITRFARYWGTAFQIKNDLEDWVPNENKRIPAQDVLQDRPTILRAFALESLQEEDRKQFFAAIEQNRLEQIYALYEKAGVFDKARLLIEKYIERAKEAVERIDHKSLRDFLYHLFEAFYG
jgi:geranylgeranyl pyrophosphate synthase